MQFTYFLRDLTSKDVMIAWGKWASLGEMIHAWIPVPWWFVVLSDTFDYFLKKTWLDIQIEAILDSVNHKIISSVEEASESIQSLVLSFPMPIEIEKEIYTSFDTEQLEYVAVRSSATAEDGAEHARAGQLDSYLNTTREDLIQKVRKCWASLFTPRAIFYRFEKDLHNDHISVAVVVQKMVQSEVSGIAFSVHPVTQDRNQMIVEAWYGLGEAIVSWSVTPDSYVVRKDNNEIDITVNHQQKALYRAKTWWNEWIQLGEKGKDQILNQEQVSELSTIILRIENHYGFPCDIEWAYEWGKFYIVQSRPITTLQVEQKEKKKRYTIIASDFQSPLVRNEIWCLLPSFWWEWYSLFMPSVWISSHNNAIDYFVDLKEWIKTKEQFQEKIKNNPLLLKEVIELSSSMGEEMNEFTSQLLNNSLEDWSDDKLINFYKRFCFLQSREYAIGVLLPLIDIHGVSFLESFLKEYLTKNLSKNKFDDAFKVFTTPINNSFALDQEMDLLLLADKIFKKEENRTMFLENNSLDILSKLQTEDIDIYNKIREHTKRYCWVYYVYSGPAFEDIQFVEFLKDILNKDINPIKEYNRRVTERNDLIGKRNEYLRLLNPSKKEKVLIELISTYILAKPRRKDYQSRSYYHLESFYKEIAKRLNISMDLIRSATQEQIYQWILTGDIDINNLKLQYEHHICYFNEGKVINLTGEQCQEFVDTQLTKEKIEIENNELIIGSTAFHGKVTGIVKVINDNTTMHKMEVGNILVSIATTPNIVPAMKKASAIITDEGGLTCHAAIVSRELEVPCVVGTRFATQILKDWDLVEVDADNWVVRVLEKEWILRHIDFFKNMDISYEWWRACYKCMAVLLNTWYIIKDPIVEIPDQFWLISISEWYTTKRYRYIDDTARYDLYLQKVLGWDDLLERSKETIEAIKNQRFLRMKNLWSITALDNHELKNLFREYIEYYTHIACQPFIIRMIDRGIIRAVNNYNIQDFDDTLALISIPSQSTSSVLEEDAVADLIEVVLQNNYDKNHPTIINMLQDILSRFARISLWYYNEEAKTLSTYQNIISNDPIKRLDEYRHKKSQYQVQQNKRQQRLSTQPNNILQLAEVASKASWLKDYYKFSVNHMQYIAEPLWKEISYRTEYNVEYLKDLLPEEIEELLTSGIINEELIDHRISHSLMYTKDKELNIITGKEALLCWNIINPDTHNISSDNSRSGRSACRGVYSGIARIILSPHDFEKVQQGDVLVVMNTSPDFIVLFDKVWAILAEEWGVTAHVSVVSREYNIPCIVWLQNITKILKDWDLVEVDADKWIVKILKNPLEDLKSDHFSFQASRPHTVQRDEMVYCLYKDYPFTLQYLTLPFENNSRARYISKNFEQQLFDQYQKQLATRSWFEDVKKRYEEIKHTITDYIEDLKNITWESSQILYFFDTYTRLLWSYSDFAWMCYPVERIIDGQLHQILKNQYNDGEDIYTYITNPTILNDYQQMRKSLLEAYIRHDDPSFMCKQLAQDYCRSTEYSYREKPLCAEDLLIERNQLDIIKAQKELDWFEHVIHNRNLYEQALARIDNEWLKLQAEVVQWFIYQRTDRIDWIRRPQYASRVIYNMLANILWDAWTYDDVLYCTNKEITNFLRLWMYPSYEEVLRRKQSYIGYADGKDYIVETDTTVVRSLCDRFLTSSQNQTLVQGKVAYPWVVQWTVVKVFTKDDLEKITNTSILVARTTMIEYTWAMNVAAGFVTAEWWITSHAAIIARELKKPCIVGTIHCMEIFDDGDLIEIDANNWVVRLISKKSDTSIIPSWLVNWEYELVGSRPMIFQRDEMICMCFAKYMGLDWLSVSIDWNNRSMYSNSKQIDIQYEDFFQHIFVDKENWNEHKKNYSEFLSWLQQFHISYSLLSNYSNQELADYFSKWNTWLLDFWPYVTAPFVVERRVDPFVRDLLVNTYGETLADTYFSIASSPTEYIQYQCMRIDICTMVIAGDIDIQKLVDTYYRYSEYVFTEQLLDEQYFIDEINNLTVDQAKHERDEIVDTITENREKYNTMKWQISHEEVLHRLDIINTYVHLRTDRVDVLKQGQVWIRYFYQTLAERLGRLYEDVLLLTNSEIVVYLEKGMAPSPSILQQRQPDQYYFFYEHVNDSTYVVTDTISLEKVKWLLDSYWDDKISWLVWYPGRVQWIVKKIYSREDISKIQPGDVLVARHTMIDYTPAMKIAVAFVTDEGWITSHAAIVARELKKPCILGCKHAMKYLEDWDLVEVDANNGVVKIISSD